MKCTKCDSNIDFSRPTHLKRHQARKACQDHRTNEISLPPPTDAVWAQTTSRWKFKHPATLMVCGPTGSGKTVTLVELIKRGMFDPLPQHIVVFHGEEQDIYKNLPTGTKFIRGWSTDEVDKVPNNSLIIIDDLMSEVKDCKYMSKLFTKISHHRNISVAWLTQNIFPKGKECRDVSLNSQYMLLFPNPRDQAQLRYLSSQMFPGQTSRFIQEFKRATEKPYDPVLLILRQDQPPNDRIIKHILAEQPKYIDL